jgi:hypothetical protein
MTLTYKGSFVAADDTVYRFEIYEDSIDKQSLDELNFPYDEPAVIEWEETDKLSPIQGSALTLKVNSDYDRQFLRLYTTKPGAVIIKVYRNDTLYWIGSLDTEQYEEPYAAAQDYDVTLTFSDFAILKRISWSHAHNDRQSLREIIEECLTPTHLIDDGSLDITYNAALNDIYEEKYKEIKNWIDIWGVVSDNWYDEDDEPMTLYDVLEAVLKPLGLRIIQKGGTLRVYDLEAVCQGFPKSAISWASDDQVLSVDSVYNKVNLTLSQYADDTVLDGTISEDDLKFDSSNKETWKLALSPDDDSWIDGFNMQWGTAKSGLPSLMTLNASVFKLTSQYSSCEGTGVCCAFRYNVNDKTLPAFSNMLYSTELGNERNFLNNYGSWEKPLIRLNGGYLRQESGYNIRIKLDMLLDARYNPFEDADGNQADGAADYLKYMLEFVYVPCRLTLRDANGEAIVHYSNSRALKGTANLKPGTCGSWVNGEGEWGEMYLAYYDWENRRENSAVCDGWATNRPMVGCAYYDTIPTNTQRRGDGEFIPAPSYSGWLDFEIAPGITWLISYDREREICDINGKGTDNYNPIRDLLEKVDGMLRWLLLRNPTITVVSSTGGELPDSVKGDICYSAWLDSSAEDSLDIDTVVGSTTAPTAKAMLLRKNTATGKFAYYAPTFNRAGIGGGIEKLLIGTAYSQYATRHAILEGTADLIPKNICVSDAAYNSGGTRFILLSEVQSLRENTSEIKASELTEENYESLEIDIDYE